MTVLKRLQTWFRNYHNQLYLLLQGLLFVGIWAASWARLDPDFGWHLRTGQYVLLNWIPKHDIFTYTAPYFEWINHEWFNDIIIAKLFGLGGYGLVAGFFAGLWTLSLRLASRNKLLLPAIVAVVALLPFIGIRPIAWGVLFFCLLERILNTKQKSLAWLLPLLMLFWANLHGSFALGLLIIVLWQIFSKSKIPWTCLVLSFLATLINPYGWHIYVEITRTVLDTKLHNYIIEWKSLELPWVSVLYVVCLAIGHFINSKKPLRQLASIPGLLLAMSLSSIRHFPLFVSSSFRYFENYQIQLINKFRGLKLSISRKVIVIILLTIFISTFSYLTWREVGDFKNENRIYPSKAVTYLKTHPCSGNLFNSYSFGGYLIWQLPGQKVYIDGRMPSWKTSQDYYLENYFNFFIKSDFRNSEIQRWQISCVLVDTNELQAKERQNFVSDLENQGWQKIPEASSGRYLLIIKPQ